MYITLVFIKLLTCLKQLMICHYVQHTQKLVFEFVVKSHESEYQNDYFRNLFCFHEFIEGY